MKWLAIIFGVIFVLLFVVALTLPWRFQRHGQHIVFDLKQGFVRVESAALAEEVAVDDVVGLQTLSRYNETQLNIVGFTNNVPFRLWVHTDLHGNIAKLVSDFEVYLGWRVVSHIRCVGKRG
ncbi:hypothetical protein FYK55_17145 [Roseiconus nitratireducens]|uniref:Uncharacterized protein n=1 Tax=Roseiconus nitratireducens TaxID=2605748 RepID=A0A5M6D6P7_9BACT|nr:hypothetical protein [Roseiconus nitratireducens]KAA5541922.1 hypothetical protein FYK55_17145 [Roseiconus nitratireducens]